LGDNSLVRSVVDVVFWYRQVARAHCNIVASVSYFSLNGFMALLNSSFHWAELSVHVRKCSWVSMCVWQSGHRLFSGQLARPGCPFTGSHP
jgi:hypothetical protein